jgi:predicted nucleic acid-binding protein
MAYNITSAKFYRLQAEKKYFLDANIWIFILSPSNKPPHRIAKYLELFEEILKNSTVKIVVPSLLISEVINRIIKSVYYPEFLRKKGINIKDVNQEYYKDTFRPSQEYKDSYVMLTDDFIAYSENIELVNDGLGTEINYDDILVNPPTNLDFNDNYYYSLALKRDYIVITDDKDFWVEGIKVVTQNTTLLDKQTAINIQEVRK